MKTPASLIAATIRKLALRGSNAKLLEALDRIYVSGIEEGMRRLSEQLKERINVIQGTDISPSTDGEWKQSDSSESAEGHGADTNN